MGKRAIPLILAGCIFLGGCALLAYPRVSQWLNNLHQSEVIADYSSAVDGLDDGKAQMSNRSAEMSGVLLIKEATKKGYKEAAPGDSIKLGYTRGNTKRGRVGKAFAHTLDTSCAQGIVESGGRIRRLMPRECLRLQGFGEDQIDRLLAITSDAQAYKQAGNSVTVNVIEAFGRNLKAVHAELRGGT